MKAFAILLCVYMVSSVVSSLPIISKPLENNPDHLVWEALLTIDTHRPDDKTRKIPKSIFITPNLNESKGNCPPDHKLGPDGRCYKTLKIDPLVILKTQIESLLKKNRTATTEYDDDYDYSEYGESTESMNANGQYTVPLSLGFGNDHRPMHLQQQQQQQQKQQQHHQSQAYTTFPNLNRVVKDDSHIAPGLHISSEKENQPFLVSTTGLGLDSEGDFKDIDVESKIETSSSVATASSMVPSSTKDANSIGDTESSSTSGSVTVGTATTNPTSTVANADTTTTVHERPPETISVSTKPKEIVSMDDEHFMPKSSTNNLKALDTISSAEPLEATTIINNSAEKAAAPTTEQGHTMIVNPDPIENVTTSSNEYSSENPNNRDSHTNGSIATTMPFDEIDSSTMSVPSTEQLHNDGATHLIQSDDTIAQSSTNIPTDSIEPNQNETHKQLPTLSQILGKSFETPHKPIETTTDDGTDSMPKQTNVMNDVTTLKQKSNDDDDDESTTLAAMAQTVDTSNDQMIKWLAENYTEPTSTVDTLMANLMVNKSESNDDSNDELIDAVFIPSQFDIQLTDEMDPAVGKTFNNSADNTKYQLENASIPAIVDTELAEAEMAPIIDTGKRANIEFIDGLDESAPTHIVDNEDDAVKNLSARLADELLFLNVANENETRPMPSSSTSTLSLQATSEIMPTNDASAKNDSSTLFEETLNGAEPALGIGLNSDVTTEEAIDYDSNKAKMDSQSVGNLANSNSDEAAKHFDYDSGLSEKEPPFQIPPFVVIPSPLVQQPQQNHQKPSIYSTFMNRLKYAPPIIDLSVDNNRPKSTAQYSHSPFDLASAIQSVNVNRRSTPPVTSSQPASTIVDHPIDTTTTPNGDGDNDNDGGGSGGGGGAAAAITHDNVPNVESPGIINLSPGRDITNRHQLQIGINCYLRNLVNKQQFIICDNE